jgi:hypothetical protein
MQPDDAPPPDSHGLTHDDARNDFRSQATFCQPHNQCRGAQASRRPACSDDGSARARIRCPTLVGPAVAAPRRSASVRVSVRDGRGHAHDPALASGVVRQPSPAFVSLASRPGKQRVRARRFDWFGRAQCMDRILGGDSISRRMKNRRWSLVVGRWSFAITSLR